jgi:hypothetical protein
MKNNLLLSIIIPTKDRVKLLTKTLIYLKKNIFFFNEVIIIDSSEKNIISKKQLNSFKKLNIKYYTSKPSSAIQRNLGLKYINKKNKFVFFLDDDLKFYSKALKKMKYYIERMEPEIIGIGFNPIKKNINNFLEKIKNSIFFCKFGIYDTRPGVITPSGWHTKIQNIKKNRYVEWLPTGACIYKINKIKSLKFERILGKYSYLEDLIFSHNASKKGKLIINSQAKFIDSNFIKRNDFLFGIIEIKNRLIFIKKNNLKIKNFLLGYLFFLLNNLFLALSDIKIFQRLAGNLIGIIYLFKKIK